MATILKIKTVKTRKKHTCFGCCENISIGTTVSHVVSVESGDLTSAYWCDKCQKILDEVDHLDAEEGFFEGQIKDMFPERFKIEVEK